MQTTTRSDLCEKIVSKANNPQPVVKETVQMLLDKIVQELSHGNRIALKGFGVFEVKQRAARKARNPRTGEEAFVPAKKVVVFKGGKLMKEKVNDSQIKQEQPIPENTEELKLTDDSKSGFEKVNESKKETSMANLTPDAEIKGTIKFGEAMRMDSKFEGELISENGELVVGKTGNVKANINARSVVIEGRVDGNIIASDRVELKRNAHLIGDLQAKTLVIEEGVVFVGQCNVNPEGTKIESRSYKKRNYHSSWDYIQNSTKKEAKKTAKKRFPNIIPTGYRKHELRLMSGFYTSPE